MAMGVWMSGGYMGVYGYGNLCVSWVSVSVYRCL